MRVKTAPDRDWRPYMKRALELAREAERCGDVPVGALIVDKEGAILSESFNQREALKDSTAHAEILALRGAGLKNQQWRMTGATLVVTLEPCVMCSGALSLSRIDRVVFGASDPKAGGMGSAYHIHEDRRLNHEIMLEGGILEQECRELLVNFFRSKREKSKKSL